MLVSVSENSQGKTGCEGGRYLYYDWNSFTTSSLTAFCDGSMSVCTCAFRCVCGGGGWVSVSVCVLNAKSRCLLSLQQSLSIYLYLSPSYLFLRQGLSLNPRLINSPILAVQRTSSMFSFPNYYSYMYVPLCPRVSQRLASYMRLLSQSRS